MTKQELEKKIEELQKQIDDLKNIKIEGKQKKWKPALGEIYYNIGYDGSVDKFAFDDTSFDNDCVKLGNCFATREEAQFVADKIKYTQMFKGYIEEHSTTLDWRDSEPNKCYIYYDYEDNAIGYDNEYNWRTQGTIYASSEQILQDAVAYVGEDNVKKYVLGVEE